MSKKSFIVGPLDKSKERLDDFASSLYLQKLYNETIDELVTMQQKYDAAILEDDDVTAASLLPQIKFLENVVSLANNNMTSFMSDVIYYD